MDDSEVGRWKQRLERQPAIMRWRRSPAEDNGNGHGVTALDGVAKVMSEIA